MSTILDVQDLHVAYGGIEAVGAMNLSAAPGQIVSVIGPNGAGKTTLLSAIMGILPYRGRVRFKGENMAGCEIEARVARGMSLVPEKRELFASMSVEDNLRLGGFRHRGKAGSAGDLEDIYIRFPRLKERRRQAAGTLSGGERQMLAMGRALMGRPDLLMLDEPSLGLAPLVTREIFKIVAGLRDAGRTILLIEQNARAALQIADYAYVLELGRVTLEGPASRLADDPRVIETYLGIGHAAV